MYFFIFLRDNAFPYNIWIPTKKKIEFSKFKNFGPPFWPSNSHSGPISWGKLQPHLSNRVTSYWLFSTLEPTSKNCVFYQFTKTRNFRNGSKRSWNCVFYQLSNMQLRQIRKSHNKLHVLAIYLRIASIASIALIASIACFITSPLITRQFGFYLPSELNELRTLKLK